MDVVTTAGLDFGQPAEQTSPRREMLKRISAILRRTDASEAEHLDALEGLVELTKE